MSAPNQTPNTPPENAPICLRQPPPPHLRAFQPVYVRSSTPHLRALQSSPAMHAVCLCPRPSPPPESAPVQPSHAVRRTPGLCYARHQPQHCHSRPRDKDAEAAARRRAIEQRNRGAIQQRGIHQPLRCAEQFRWARLFVQLNRQQCRRAEPCCTMPTCRQTQLAPTILRLTCSRDTPVLACPVLEFRAKP
jgi:hypothetical protein